MWTVLCELGRLHCSMYSVVHVSEDTLQSLECCVYCIVYIIPCMQGLSKVAGLHYRVCRAWARWQGYITMCAGPGPGGKATLPWCRAWAR